MLPAVQPRKRIGLRVTGGASSTAWPSNGSSQTPPAHPASEATQSGTQAVSATPGLQVQVGVAPGGTRRLASNFRGELLRVEPGRLTTPVTTPPAGSSGGAEGLPSGPSLGVLETRCAELRSLVNDQKLKISELEEDKRLGSSHAALLLERLTAVSGRNKKLEEQAVENARLNAAFAAKRRHPRDDASACDDLRSLKKKRKSYKHALLTLRTEAIEKMADAKGPVPQLRIKVSLF